VRSAIKMDKYNTMFVLQPLTPSNAKPDMAVLRLIKESDLRRSGIIGSGAFGTVYKVLYTLTLKSTINFNNSISHEL